MDLESIIVVFLLSLSAMFMAYLLPIVPMAAPLFILGLFIVKFILVVIDWVNGGKK